MSQTTSAASPWVLWAKTDRSDQERWHALPYHHLEVGAVAHVLWRDAISAIIRQRWAERLGVDDETAGRWIAFIAASHDVGKASIKFQSLVPTQAARILHETNGAIHLPADVRGDFRHGLISAYVLPDILRQHYGLTYEAANRYAIVTGGHHGVLATQPHLNAVDLARDTAVGMGSWHDLRVELVDWLHQAFELPAELPERIRTTTLTYDEALWLAGFISLADWVGSDEDHFPFNTTPAPDPVMAREHAESQAREALGAAGWYYQPLAIPTDRWNTTFPFDPHPAQQIATDAIRAMKRPGIAVVEYPMGTGKTEIALWTAAHMQTTFGVSGFYVAMPTMTTADQLHTRVADHFRRHATDDVNLQLLHGQAALRITPKAAPEVLQGIGSITAQDEVDQDRRLDKLQNAIDPEAPSRRESRKDPVQRASWFTKRKRGLLATYGVGTVDQALLAILQSKHFFVRMHGLTGKTIIFDEVHAYDTYMSTLFDELLTWLGALGSPVVILTATLPAHRTRELIAAYNRGAGWAPEAIEIAPYPRITTSDGDRVHSVSSPIDLGQQRTVALRRMPTDTTDEAALFALLGEQLDLRLRNGGTAALICNTVKQAQLAYDILQQWFDPAKGELELFHARFRQLERGKIQERVLQDLGKQTHDARGKRLRPLRKIIIATQVIEQSLDLDVDLMVSLFCPTDLLLQRMGRLQRHATTDTLRPEGLRSPELWLAGYDETADGPRFLRGSQAVYGTHILLRSWLALDGVTAITIPDDVETLIEATYAEHVEVPDDLRDLWEKSAESFARQRDREERTAEGSHIPKLTQDHPELDDDALLKLTFVGREQDDDPSLHADALARTRLGPPSISVVILTPEESILYKADGNRDSENLTFWHIRTLLERAVSLADARIVRHLRDQPIPASWEATSFLRHHRLIELDEHGRYPVTDDLWLELDPAKGVLFRTREELLLEESSDE